MFVVGDFICGYWGLYVNKKPPANKSQHKPFLYQSRSTGMLSPLKVAIIASIGSYWPTTLRGAYINDCYVGRPLSNGVRSTTVFPLMSAID